jgi:hypothetical protein
MQSLYCGSGLLEGEDQLVTADTVRQVYNRALQYAALDVQQGARLWEAARSFEQGYDTTH